MFDSAGNSSQARAVVSGGMVKNKIDETRGYKVTFPGKYPDSETQPMGVGNVQEGRSFYMKELVID